MSMPSNVADAWVDVLMDIPESPEKTKATRRSPGRDESASSGVVTEPAQTEEAA